MRKEKREILHTSAFDEGREKEFFTELPRGVLFTQEGGTGFEMKCVRDC
jgi:hypothetical protein